MQILIGKKVIEVKKQICKKRLNGCNSNKDMIRFQRVQLKESKNQFTGSNGWESYMTHSELLAEIQQLSRREINLATKYFFHIRLQHFALEFSRTLPKTTRMGALNFVKNNTSSKTTRRKTGKFFGRFKAISIKNLSNGASRAKNSSGIENISTENQAQVELDEARSRKTS